MITQQAEARQLKGGRWRIYSSDGHLQLARDPVTGTIATFETLADAQRWWAQPHPGRPPLDEAPRCARCGGYFGPMAESIELGGHLYHASHAPQMASAGSRRR
jgi:hypothetical protein